MCLCTAHSLNPAAREPRVDLFFSSFEQNAETRIHPLTDDRTNPLVLLLLLSTTTFRLANGIGETRFQRRCTVTNLQIVE